MSGTDDFARITMARKDRSTRFFVLVPDGSWDLFEEDYSGPVHMNNLTTDHMLALLEEHAELAEAARPWLTDAD